ncbi:MAG: hypothetical protein HZB81_03620 [Deltaproteobacteria bacterium]|nr:hypothetical protein [Deltaproteobacteria bacterium]
MLNLIKTNISSLILVIVALLGTTPTFAQSEVLRPEAVSIVQLLANPEKYQGHLVMVTGFCRIEFEGNAIYLHQDDYTYGNTKNGIWLGIDRQEVRFKFEKGHCLVVGRFDAKNQGHMGLFSGALNDIKRFESWPPQQPKQ